MKNYCRHCGAKLDPEQKHECPKLQIWATIKKVFFRLVNYLTNDDNIEANTDYYERGKAIIPECVRPEDGEVTVKQYDLAVLRTRHKLTRAEGKMQITNKRIIFRGTGRSPAGKTVFQSEFAMDKIDGVEIRRDYRFLFWDFFKNLYLSSIFLILGGTIGEKLIDSDDILPTVFAFLLSFLSAVPFFVIKRRHLLKLFLLSVGQGIMGILVFRAGIGESSGVVLLAGFVITVLLVLYLITLFLSFFKPNLVIEVKTSSGSPGLQVKYRFASFFIWKKMEENSGFAEILPGKDADLAIKEIGAIINDIKTLGDLGVDKWKV